jgi:hypothetical protein
MNLEYTAKKFRLSNLESAGGGQARHKHGGQGFHSPPLEAIIDIPIDTLLLCGRVVHFPIAYWRLLSCSLKKVEIANLWIGFPSFLTEHSVYIPKENEILMR